MCFSPKIKTPKTPKVDTQAMKAVDPAPLTKEPKGVLFGGEDDTDATSTSSEVPSGSSIKASKVELDDTASKQKESKKTNGGVRKSIGNKAFGK